MQAGLRSGDPVPDFEQKLLGSSVDNLAVADAALLEQLPPDKVLTLNPQHDAAPTS